MKSNFFKLFEKSLKRGIELPPGGVKTEKEVFYLNDFYDLLYEKENTVSHSGTNPPEYFESEKYYTMGPGIDFPMIMSYKDTENPDLEPYYYFLNGHNDVVFFADSNFTEELSEDYEYNYFGVPNNLGNKSSLLFNSFEYDEDTNLYNIGNTYYNPFIGLVLKNLNYSNEAVSIGMPLNIFSEVIKMLVINSISEKMMPTGEEPEGQPWQPLPPPPAPICGNGKWEKGEQCDDGNTNDNDCCDNNCNWTGNCRGFKPQPKSCVWTVAKTSIVGVHILVCVPYEPR